jgi:DNA modification methylase
VVRIPGIGEWVPAADLVPWDRNPKAHPVENVAGIARSIKRFGFAAPIVAWRSRRQIVAGHGRLLAAQLLYREDPGQLLATDQPGPGLVPVRFLEFANDGEAAALAIADNRFTEANPMDDGVVADLLRELQEGGTSIEGLGYDDALLKELLAPPPVEPSADDDEAPEPPAEPVSRLGEVYELGPHRLVCGDSQDAEVWAKLLPIGERLQMTWTDPPYGVAHAGGSKAIRAEERVKQGGMAIENDSMTPAELEQLLRGALGLAAGHCIPGSSWYVAAPQMPIGPYISFVTIMNELEIARHMLIWVKDSLVMSKSDYHYRHEPIFYGWVPGAAHYFVDDRKQDSVLEFARPKRSKEHPTMKPVALVAKCIENSSKPGWIVGEPFGGSGTTLIACAQTGRVARLIELDPRYCDVIRRRWSAWAKQNNRPVGTGGLE